MKLIKSFSIAGRIAGRLSPRKQIVNRCGLKTPSGFGWLRNPRKFLYDKIYNRVNKRPTDWLGL